MAKGKTSSLGSKRGQGRVSDVDYLLAVRAAGQDPTAVNGAVLPSQVASVVGRSEVTTRLKLRELEKQGLLKPHGRGAGGHGRKTYLLADKGEKAIEKSLEEAAEAPEEKQEEGDG